MIAYCSPVTLNGLAMITKETENRIKVSLPRSKRNPIPEIKTKDDMVKLFRGLTGKTGVGIKDIQQSSTDSFTIRLTNGLKKLIKIPQPMRGKQGNPGAPGTPGKNGRGIESITQPEDDVARINYTDGTFDLIKLPRGEDGREIELGYSDTHLQWRYVGESEWKNLFPIPKDGISDGLSGAGSLRVVTTVNGLIGAIRIVAGDNITINNEGKDVVISAPGADSSLMGTLFIKTPTNETIILVASAVYPFTINGIDKLSTSSGTVKVTLQINGVNVTGLAGISANSITQDVLATGNNDVNIGDELTVILSDNSASSRLRFTMGMARI